MGGETNPSELRRFSNANKVQQPRKSAAEPPSRPHKPPIYPPDTLRIPSGCRPDALRTNTGSPRYTLRGSIVPVPRVQAPTVAGLAMGDVVDAGVSSVRRATL